jgi:hypothetical protein
MRPKRATVSKLLGDAGEHYALSQFSFAGRSAAKMPDNWEGYDLAVENAPDLLRISVKTRSDTKSWDRNSWFNFDDRQTVEWLVFIFKARAQRAKAWVIPFDVALAHANVPGARRKDAWYREIAWRKLLSPPLSLYEDNWELERF